MTHCSEMTVVNYPDRRCSTPDAGRRNPTPWFASRSAGIRRSPPDGTRASRPSYWDTPCHRPPPRSPLASAPARRHDVTIILLTINQRAKMFCTPQNKNKIQKRVKLLWLNKSTADKYVTKMPNSMIQLGRNLSVVYDRSCRFTNNSTIIVCSNQIYPQKKTARVLLTSYGHPCGHKRLVTIRH